MTQYYCYSCNSKPNYLADVSDSESPDFEKACCPYCNSTAVIEAEVEDEYQENEAYEIYREGNSK